MSSKKDPDESPHLSWVPEITMPDLVGKLLIPSKYVIKMNCEGLQLLYNKSEWLNGVCRTRMKHDERTALYELWPTAPHWGICGLIWRTKWVAGGATVQNSPSPPSVALMVLLAQLGDGRTAARGSRHTPSKYLLSSLLRRDLLSHYLCWQRYVDWNWDWAVLETALDDVVVVPFHRERFLFISPVLRDKGLTK